MEDDDGRYRQGLAGCVALAVPQIALPAACVALALSQGEAWLGFLMYAVGEGMIGLLLFAALTGGDRHGD